MTLCHGFRDHEYRPWRGKLLGVRIRTCRRCGNTDVTIGYVTRILVMASTHRQKRKLTMAPKNVLQSVNDIMTLFVRAERAMGAARACQEEAARELITLCETLGITLPRDMAPYSPELSQTVQPSEELPYQP